MKLLYVLLAVLLLVSFIKMSLYLGFLTLGIMLGLFLYGYFSKKIEKRKRQIEEINS